MKLDLIKANKGIQAGWGEPTQMDDFSGEVDMMKREIDKGRGPADLTQVVKNASFRVMAMGLERRL